MHILLIDDDRTALATLATALSPATYEVARALTPEQARMMFHEHGPDLVVLEVALAQNAGWTLLKEFVAAGARVLVLTRDRRSELVVQALQAGAIDVVGKPFVPAELLARIELRLRQPAPTIVAALDGASSAAGSDDAPAATPPPLLRRQEGETLGEQLRKARKQRNISLVQANLETRIQMYYIQALEEDKYGLLPRSETADEIVQQYASFLGLDPSEALAEFQRIHHREHLGVRDLAGQPLQRNRPWLRWIVLLVVALLACVLATGALALIFPTQMGNVVTNVRELFAAPTATPTAPPPPPTAAPMPTDQPTPTLAPSPIPSPTLRPTPTVAPSPQPTP